jgi:hypothetical protein
MAEKTFSKLEVLSSFRTTSTGDFFNIIPSAVEGEPGTFFSLNSYMFKEIAAGNIKDITFEDAGFMPPSNDRNGQPRPKTIATKVKSINGSERADLLGQIDTGKLKVELQKVKNELKDLGVDL